MKKLLLLLCSLTLCFAALTACGDGGNGGDANRYTVTLLTEGGEGGSATQEVVYGKEYTLSAPTRTGYTFDCWEDDEGKAYALSGTWQTKGNLVLKATWTANEYDLILLAGDGAKFSDESTQKTISVTYDGAIPTLPTPTKEGHAFTSWTYDGKALPNLWNFTTSITATANWVEVAPETCTIIFVQAGEDVITKTVNKGETLTDVPAVATKIGYDCVWDRTDFTNITENITVNAIETPKTYVITFDADGGSLSVTEQTVTFNGAYTLPTPTKKGFIFLGWYDGETEYTGGTWTTAKEVTLKAKWQKEPDPEADWTGFH